MDLLMWFIQWFASASVYIQIAFDTGWLAQQAQTMPFIMQTIHDRLEAWINDEGKKK